MGIDKERFDAARRVATNLVNEIEKVVVGKTSEVTLLVTALISGGHVLIEDVPGVGKTTLAAALAQAAGLSFKRAQFTPDVMASDITGFNIYNRSAEKFEFKDGLVMCNIMLADEINRASPKTQSALLEAMEERRVTVDGSTYDIPDPFMVIATQNPTGYIGTYPLPEAQLDRFALKLSMGYPSAAEEISIMKARRISNPAEGVTAVANEKVIRVIRNLISDVDIDESIYEYIVNLTAATRTHSALTLGASPRASLALARMGQAYAFMRGRDYVTPEDIAAIYIQTTAHRVILRQESRLGKVTPESVLTGILRETRTPLAGTRGRQ
ncbi:MAG: MoxR family ATPase [Clostridia bacterium]|nr:MoxR family ATPase [Clostridia bacterium]MBQ4575661.1 MoxR family ATPase [Clostridia bacterium]